MINSCITHYFSTISNEDDNSHKTEFVILINISTSSQIERTANLIPRFSAILSRQAATQHKLLPYAGCSHHRGSCHYPTQDWLGSAPNSGGARWSSGARDQVRLPGALFISYSGTLYRRRWYYEEQRTKLPVIVVWICRHDFLLRLCNTFTMTNIFWQSKL